MTYESRLILPQVITYSGSGFLKALHSLIWGRMSDILLIVYNISPQGMVLSKGLFATIFGYIGAKQGSPI